MPLNKHTDTIPDDAVYIGRGSPWGNPFVLHPQGEGKPIHTLGYRRLCVLAPSRESAVAAYRRLLWQRIGAHPPLLEALAALDGKPLVCFCSPRPCHGDVLESAARWATDHLDKLARKG